MTTVKQRQLSDQPATNKSPHIVENQCGSSVITQSTTAKVTVNAKNTSVGPENAVALPSQPADSS
jgi:hypothetical protein